MCLSALNRDHVFWWKFSILGITNHSFVESLSCFVRLSVCLFEYFIHSELFVFLSACIAFLFVTLFLCLLKYEYVFASLNLSVCDFALFYSLFIFHNVHLSVCFCLSPIPARLSLSVFLCSCVSC
jgi:hypothetical protein